MFTCSAESFGQPAEMPKLQKRQLLRIFGDFFCNFLKFLGISETMYVLIIDIIHYLNPIESNQIDKIHLDFSSSTGN